MTVCRQVSADLTNVQDNTEIWGQQYERKASDIISLQQQIAGDIALKLRSTLNGTEKQQVTKQGTQNAEAYQLYVKGRYYWSKRTSADIKTAISYCNQAVDEGPGYALADAGLADAYFVPVSIPLFVYRTPSISCVVRNPRRFSIRFAYVTSRESLRSRRASLIRWVSANPAYAG